MHEVLEGHEEHKEGPFTLKVSITIATLAVLLAAVTLMGHRASTDMLYNEGEASNRWAYFQAKSIRAAVMKDFAESLGVLTTQDKEKAAALQERFAKEAERYDHEKDQISEEAKEFENERLLAGRKADRYDAGEGFLEISIVICSLTLLTKKNTYWIVGMFVGAIGLLVAASALFIR